jgi:GTP cyclohydrolase IB
MPKLPDTQSEPDKRRVDIQNVGVRALRYPVIIDEVPTIGVFALSVFLPKEARGTHMSRFVALVQKHHHALSSELLLKLTQELAESLESGSAEIELKFPWFIEKAAPVTKTLGHLDYDVTWLAKWDAAEGAKLVQKLTIPVATLCPCSKAISDRGAHNQRGHLTLTVAATEPPKLSELIQLGEAAASCELYSALKRPDEKHVTEQAYDQPAFVEDVVREATVALRKLPGVTGFRVEAENFESIHNHNAFAVVEEGTL